MSSSVSKIEKLIIHTHVCVRPNTYTNQLKPDYNKVSLYKKLGIFFVVVYKVFFGKSKKYTDYETLLLFLVDGRGLFSLMLKSLVFSLLFVLYPLGRETIFFLVRANVKG